MASTTNFNWTTPDDTDLVKDGAAAIRTLGSAIDTSLVDLKGGTTGQVLSKATGTDMDFSWTTPTDQTPLTTKGDLFGYSTADARIPVGSDGQVLTADSAESLGVKWAAPASGGSLTLLATGTLSGSVVTINSISGDYTDLRLDLIDFYASSDAYAQLKLNNVSLEYDGDATYYQSSVAYTATCEISGNTDGSDQANFTTVRIPLYSVSGIRKLIYSWFNVANPTTAANGNIGGWKTGSKITNAVTRLDINPSAGTWSGGTYNLYGVK